MGDSLAAVICPAAEAYLRKQIVVALECLHSPKEIFVEGVAGQRRRQRLPGARQAVLPAVKAPMMGVCIDHVGRIG